MFVRTLVFVFVYIFKVFSFFKARIEKQYPLDMKKDNPFLHMAEQHEAFMKQRCDTVVGRTELFTQVNFFLLCTFISTHPHIHSCIIL